MTSHTTLEPPRHRGLALALTADNRRWWTLGAMCFALFMLMLDNTVVNVALPTIQRSLGLSIDGLEWTVNAYTATFAVLLVTGGRLGDIFGRRRTFLIGVLIFAGSSAFIGLAQSSTWLICGRAVQGIGAALMMPATLSIVTNAFPPHERGKAIGTWPRSVRWRWPSARSWAVSWSSTSLGSRSSSSTSRWRSSPSS